MQQVHIQFNDVEQVRQFVNSIDKVDASFDLGSGRRIVDAKSILGVMALDLSGPLQLRCHSDDKGIADIIAPFLCSEA
ncbi:MAG: HPr family phosphocarrier protein [Lachnospiraceae bacterium]|nr:HPr family phosphocarrier protein [Lachnospiraceae bacterium]